MSKNSLNGLADKLAEKSGLSQIEAELFIRKMFDVCHQGLAADKIVKMRWLGTFKVTSVKERESVDVNTGERIVIEGRDKISFTPDNILKEIVNRPFAQFETVIVNDGVDFESIDKKYEDSLENEEQEESLEKPKPIIEVVEPTETPLPDVVSEETTQAEAVSSSEPTTRLGGKVAYLLLKSGVSDLKHQMDSEEYGGAPFLGAKQPVIKAHGSSKAKGIKNAIRQAKICVENDLCGTMQSALDELAAAQKTEE